MKKGFSLLEVLASLAILSVIFVALLQGQGDNLYIIDTIKKRQIAQKYIREKLYAIERKQEPVLNGVGYFPPSHELVGQKWILNIINEEVFGIPLRKVEYSIELKKTSEQAKYLESSMWNKKYVE